MKKLNLSVLVAALALGLNAHATVLTFEPSSNTIFGNENVGDGLAVGSWGGYDFTSSGDHFHFIDSPSFSTLPNNGTGILSEDRNYSISMVEGLGGSFDLLGLDMAGNNDNGSAALSLLITGYFTGGGTISTSITLLSAASFQSELLAGFSGLDKVTFDGIGGGGGFALDNINVVPASVPETSSMLMLIGMGVLPLIAARKRLKNA